MKLPKRFFVELVNRTKTRSKIYKAFFTVNLLHVFLTISILMFSKIMVTVFTQNQKILGPTESKDNEPSTV